VLKKSVLLIIAFIVVQNSFANPTLSGAVFTRNFDESLHDAAKSGDTELVQTLIADGADVNLLNRSDWPALHYAAINGHAETVQAFINAGANVDILGAAGRTALCYAAGHGGIATVQVLIAAGANLNSQDNTGWTALHYACCAGRKAEVLVLIHAGARLDLKDHHQGTALQCSVSYDIGPSIDRREIIRALIAAGAWFDIQEYIRNTHQPNPAGTNHLNELGALMESERLEFFARLIREAAVNNFEVFMFGRTQTDQVQEAFRREELRYARRLMLEYLGGLDAPAEFEKRLIAKKY
jgi:ankyrin repeat protein